MISSPTRDALAQPAGRWGDAARRCIPALLIIVAGVLTYWSSFAGAFVYDDVTSILDNPHIRSLWPPGEAMSLPLWNSATTVDGRPLLSLSFALNDWLFGPDPWGYHLVNLVIHIGAGLLLFGIVRRTLALPRFRERCAGRETWLALASALIWLVHPLQTESVTYIVQRAESLMGMLFLLTLYASLRGFEGERGMRNAERGMGNPPLAPPRRGTAERTSNIERLLRCWKLEVRCSMFSGIWYGIAVLACAVGVGVKEIMFSAPLLVILYDVIFVSPSLRAAVAKRWRFYAALCSTWLIMFGIIAATWTESTSDFVKISPLRYLFTQPLVILYYLRLAVWPSPLVLSYAWPLEDQWFRALFPTLAILGMLALMCRGLYRRAWYGYVTAWFFVILAPTSSFSPLRQNIVEHRMYLPLAAVVVLVVLAGSEAIRRFCSAPRQRAVLGGCLVLLLVMALGWRTHDRNRDYHDPLVLWQHNVAHEPDSRQAHSSLGRALQEAGRYPEAIAHYREATRLDSGQARSVYDLGVALEKGGRPDDAIAQYQQALRIDPGYAAAHIAWGHVLEVAGQTDEAMLHYRRAVELKPGMAKAHFSLGHALQAADRLQEAIVCYGEAVTLDPHDAAAHNNLGLALVAAGRAEQAIDHYERALAIDSRMAEFHNNLGNALLTLGRAGDAIPHYRDAQRLEPNYAEAHNNLGNALLALGSPGEAILSYRQALRLEPGWAAVHYNMGRAEQMVGNAVEAITSYRRALQLDPGMSDAYYNIGNTLVASGRMEDAIEQYLKAVLINPGHVGAHNNLGAIYREGGRLAEAIKQFEQVLRLQPHNATARANLRKTREMLGEGEGEH